MAREIQVAVSEQWDKTLRGWGYDLLTVSLNIGDLCLHKAQPTLKLVVVDIEKAEYESFPWKTLVFPYYKIKCSFLTKKGKKKLLAFSPAELEKINELTDRE